MDWNVYVRFVLAFCSVLGLIALVAWFAKRYGIAGIKPPSRRQRRLSLLENLPLDGRRRLVLVRRDDKDHLLLIGGGTDLLIESIRPDLDELK